MSTSRISESQQHRDMQHHMTMTMQQQAEITKKLATHKKHLKISEDPVESVEQVRLNRKNKQLETQSKLYQKVESLITANTTAIQGSIELFERIYEIGMQSQDHSKNQSDLMGMSREVDDLLMAFVQHANSNLGDQYLFSGSKLDTPPFRVERTPADHMITQVFYDGDNYETVVSLSEQGNKAVNLCGSNHGDAHSFGLFIDTNADVDVFKTIIQLRDQLRSCSGVSFDSSGLLQKLDAARNHLAAGQGRMASTQETFRFAQDYVIHRQGEVDDDLQKTAQADEATLMLQLRQVQDSHEMLLALISRIHSINVLDYLR